MDAATGKKIQSKIDNDIKQFKTLSSSFESMFKAEQDMLKERTKVYKTITEIQENDNPKLQDIYKTYSSKMTTFENHRKVYLDNIQNCYIPITKCYPDKLKSIKTTTSELTSKLQQIEKSKKNPNKQQDVGRLGQEAQAMQNQLYDNFCRLEKEKCEDNKHLLLSFINSEMEFHARALESLSSLFREINLIEPNEGLNSFINKYQIHSDKVQKIIQETTVQQQKREREREIQRSNVWPGNN